MCEWKPTVTDSTAKSIQKDHFRPWMNEKPRISRSQNFPNLLSMRSPRVPKFIKLGQGVASPM
jgi:hypothetical protein